MAYHPIENYGIVGDLHTVALVAENASIDFMCFPQFNSPTIFAELLDQDKGGCFKIHPILDRVRHKQLYLPDSNVLVSRFLSEQGVAEVSDFMSVEEVGEPHTLIRRARTVRGEVRFRMLCAPRFDYARASHTVERVKDGVIFTSCGRDETSLRLRATVPIQVVNNNGAAEFTLSAGNNADFILEPATSDGASPSSAPDYVSNSFKKTINYWRRWVARSNYQGRWREMVNRSALTLKLLTSQTHGSMVAGPTFGLPEQIGGVRNWDYRFTWIRDASFFAVRSYALGLYGRGRGLHA